MFTVEHSEQDDAEDEPGGLVPKAPQLTQSASDVEPVTSLYFPALHAVQAWMTAPSTSLYRPDGHASQALPARFEAVPAAQLKQEVETGQNSSLLFAASAATNVTPEEESVTLHEFSSGKEPAVACPK